MSLEAGLDHAGADAKGAVNVGDRLAPSRPRVPIWLLALITLSGTVAMHIFVPAMPAAAADLGSGIGPMQFSISLYVLGLAAGQLFYGPLSDRFGRRPVLIAGLVVYTLAGVASVFAMDTFSLLAARLFQALGGCAGLVLGRAIVRDISGTEDTARKLATMNLMVAVGPGAAPIIGGLMTTWYGWRSILVLLAFIGLALLLLAWLRVPETAPEGAGGDTRSVLKSYAGLIRSRAFIGFAIGGGCATTAMYAFVTAAPFIFTRDLGRPASETGFYVATLIVGFWIGSVIARRAIGRVSLRLTLVGANLLSAVAAIGFLVVVLSGALTVWFMVATMLIFTLGAGSASPVALTQAISVNPRAVGSASGLYGSVQMLVGAICSSLVGIGDDPALAAALVLAAAGILAQFCFWIALRAR